MSINALPWFFHFDHIAAGQSANYAVGPGVFDSQSGFHVVTVSSIRRLTWTDTDVARDARANIPATDRVVFGFLFNCPEASNTSTSDRMFALRSGGTLDFNIGLDSSGQVQVRRGTTVLETIAISIEDGLDRYVEVAVRLDNAAGSYEVRFDGVTVASATGVDTTTSGGDADQIEISRTTFSNAIYRFAYMYLKEWDDASTPGFHGPLELDWQQPDSDESANWTPDSGGTNNTQVRDASGPDDDTTHIETTGDDVVDEYGFPTIGDPDTVIAVVPFAIGTGPSGGAPVVKLGSKNGVDEDYGPELAVNPSAYRALVSDAQVLQPDGATAWTPSAVDATTILVATPAP